MDIDFVLYCGWSCCLWWDKITDHTEVFCVINDLYFNQDNKCNITCGYPDGNTVDGRF